MRLHVILALLLATVSLSGCELVEGIFKAGLWVGAIGVLVLVALVAWLVSRARGRG